MSKNAYRLNKFSNKNGYDWWWHSFVATHVKTGELKPFFIEYYVINPGLWEGKIVYGQSKENHLNGKKPCYAMIKAGTWGEDKVQLHNFYDISGFHASQEKLDCKIGPNTLTESKMLGSVSVSEKERDEHPEMMTDAGTLQWNLKIEKTLKFDVGYGSSKLFNALGIFHMYWHVQGMKCAFEGELIYNHEKYIVHPHTSYGYQDKNWGKDYTNPWIWLNCNNFKSILSHKTVEASLDIGGGCPKIFGLSLQRRILTAFYYQGEMIEFNFSKFWKKSQQDFNTHEDEQYFYWDVIAENKKFKIEVNFKCEKSKMLWVNYESPSGQKKHHKLWNGGHAEGSLKLFKKGKGQFQLIDELMGSFGGCEYGEY